MRPLLLLLVLACLLGVSAVAQDAPSDAQLDRFVGTYAVRHDHVLTFTLDDGRLHMQVDGSATTRPLTPTGPGTFTVDGADEPETLTFDVPDEGLVERVVWDAGEEARAARRVYTGGGDRFAPPFFAVQSSVIAPHAMAATSQPLATQIALDVMRAGGSAVDAAIAANAMIGLVEPTSNGIGGDLFAIVWSAEEERLYGLNASGRAPLGVTLDDVRASMEDDGQIPVHSPYSITVPGAVSGWFALHERFGRLPMDELLAPTIDYAREGAPIAPFIAYVWEGAASGGYRDQPGFADVFLPDGRAPRAGERFHNPSLANTLERIAREGRDGFYGGETAREIEAFCERAGCFITAEDLAAHEATWVDPVGVTFRGHTLWELPPNGQGITALQMLQLLQPYDLEAMGHNSAAYLHHLVEAKKIAFEDRARFYADPEFADVPVDALISREYADERRRLLDSERASDGLTHGDPRAGRGGTIYLAVGDPDGNMVSLIQSNYAGFGSGWSPEALGFGFQNRGSGFSLSADHPNVYAPGKRPFHTIIPGFITRDGAPYMAYGVMGGDVQPQGHVQVFLNHVVFGMDVQQAGDAARVLHMESTDPWGTYQPVNDGGCVAFESGIGPDVRAELEAMGHRLCDAWFFGGYQAVQWDAENEVYWGASESRVDGQAAGW